MAIEWHEASADALLLPDDSFDVALCQMSLQFFPDKPAALREIRRVLAPHGRLVLNVPGPSPRIFAVLEESLTRHLNPDVAAFVRLVFSLHDRGEIHSLMSDAGFGDVDVEWNSKTLRLPAPADFLWQYLFSTPLAGPAAQLDDDGRVALERDVVEAWQPFVKGGGLELQLGVTVATAR